jgi:hypothetical protein
MPNRLLTEFSIEQHCIRTVANQHLLANLPLTVSTGPSLTSPQWTWLNSTEFCQSANPTVEFMMQLMLRDCKHICVSVRTFIVYSFKVFYSVNYT